MTQIHKNPKVLQVVGYKKTGKTSLVCRLTERLTEMGYVVGTVKHDGHDFEPDVPLTDSWKHRESGASMTAIVSPSRSAYFEERTSTLASVLERMGSSGAGIVLVEGWKQEAYPKLALVQKDEDVELLSSVPGIAAVATWNAAMRERIASDTTRPDIPVFDYEDTERMVAWLLRQV